MDFACDPITVDLRHFYFRCHHKTKHHLIYRFPFPVSTPTMDLALREAITSQTSFSLGLSTHLISLPDLSVSNLVFSPLSLHAVLCLLVAGSTGPTLQQLLSFLSSGRASDLSILYSHISNVLVADGSAAGGPHLRYACGVWVDDSII